MVLSHGASCQIHYMWWWLYSCMRRRIYEAASVGLGAQKGWVSKLVSLGARPSWTPVPMLSYSQNSAWKMSCIHEPEQLKQQLAGCNIPIYWLYRTENSISLSLSIAAIREDLESIPRISTSVPCATRSSSQMPQIQKEKEQEKFLNWAQTACRPFGLCQPQQILLPAALARGTAMYQVLSTSSWCQGSIQCWDWGGEVHLPLLTAKDARPSPSPQPLS